MDAWRRILLERLAGVLRLLLDRYLAASPTVTLARLCGGMHPKMLAAVADADRSRGWTMGQALVVDDDETHGPYLARRLGRMGWKVTLTATAAAALEACEVPVYGLVLCDIDLGPDDGVALAGQIRELVPTSAILLMSGDPGHQPRAEAAGFIRFLAKPYTDPDLTQAMSLALGDRPAP